MCNINAYTEAIKVFLTREPQEMAGNAGAKFDAAANIIQLDYCNQTYAVNCEDGAVICPGDAGFPLTKNEKTLILQYLTCSSGTVPRGAWLSFIQLPDGPHHHQPFILEAIEPLAREFGNDFDKFLAKGRELSGSEITMGDVGMVIPVFPKISMAFCLWAGDDEFPPRANILFDAAAPLHLTTAALWVLGVEVSRKFRGEAGQQYV
jgi:hypothetical protein